MHQNAPFIHLTLHKIIWLIQWDHSYLSTACVYKVVYQLAIKFGPLFERPKSISLFSGWNGWCWCWSVQHMDWYTTKLLELPIAWFDVEHGISAILKVRLPISDVKYPCYLYWLPQLQGEFQADLIFKNYLWLNSSTLSLSWWPSIKQACLSHSLSHFVKINFQLVLILEQAGRMQDYSW